jgi:hypothetical protein
VDDGALDEAGQGTGQAQGIAALKAGSDAERNGACKGTDDAVLHAERAGARVAAWGTLQGAGESLPAKLHMRLKDV